MSDVADFEFEVVDFEGFPVGGQWQFVFAPSVAISPVGFFLPRGFLDAGVGRELQSMQVVEQGGMGSGLDAQEEVGAVV